MPYWVVAQVEAGREHAARLLVMRLGAETYLPRIRFRRAGRVRDEPLFPGYLFTRVIAQWYPIRWTPHVIRLLMDGDQPAPLSDRVVAEIRKHEIDGYVRLPTAPKLSPGRAVRILSGQFRGLTGVYAGQSAPDRERVLLQLLGRAVRVELARGDVVEPLAVASV